MEDVSALAGRDCNLFPPFTKPFGEVRVEVAAEAKSSQRSYETQKIGSSELEEARLQGKRPDPYCRKNGVGKNKRPNAAQDRRTVFPDAILEPILVAQKNHKLKRWEEKREKNLPGTLSSDSDSEHGE